MTQEKFSTLEECCEFVRLFSQLAEQKSKEEINNDVIDMHIALTKHIDEYVNRVCSRHELKCSVALNYRIRALGNCYYRTCFRLCGNSGGYDIYSYLVGLPCGFDSYGQCCGNYVCSQS